MLNLKKSCQFCLITLLISTLWPTPSFAQATRLISFALPTYPRNAIHMLSIHIDSSQLKITQDPIEKSFSLNKSSLEEEDSLTK